MWPMNPDRYYPKYKYFFKIFLRGIFEEARDAGGGVVLNTLPLYLLRHQ